MSDRFLLNKRIPRRSGCLARSRRPDLGRGSLNRGSWLPTRHGVKETFIRLLKFCLYLPGMDGVGACRVSSKGSAKPTPLQPSARRARWCPEPSLGRDRLPRERRLPAPSGLLSPELDPVERWFQEFRRELSNKAFEAVELLQQALCQALLPYSGRTLLAYESSPVSPGGWRPSMRCDINNSDRY
jgi:hypothetical protein